MKMNLVCTGLGKEYPREDTESKLRTLLSYELGIEHNVEFANVHRFGRHVRNKPRPIVVRFIYQRNLDLVLDNAHYLMGTPYGIHQQFPLSVAETRKELYPVMRHYRRQGANVRLVRDRLYVNGKLYSEPDNNDDTELTGTQPDQQGPVEPMDFSRAKTDDTDTIDILGYLVFTKLRCKIFHFKSGGIVVLLKINFSRAFLLLKTLVNVVYG